MICIRYRDEAKVATLRDDIAILNKGENVEEAEIKLEYRERKLKLNKSKSNLINKNANSVKTLSSDNTSDKLMKLNIKYKC